MSMRMVIYGIKKKFPSVRSVTAEQLQRWIKEGGRGMEGVRCLVSSGAGSQRVSGTPQRSVVWFKGRGSESQPLPLSGYSAS